jgi:hypothetical protein
VKYIFATNRILHAAMIDALFEREEMLIVVVLYTKTQFVQYLCVVVCVNVKPLTETAAIFFASS